jgi:hypothetical protein
MAKCIGKVDIHTLPDEWKLLFEPDSEGSDRFVLPGTCLQEWRIHWDGYIKPKDGIPIDSVEDWPKQRKEILENGLTNIRLWKASESRDWGEAEDSISEETEAENEEIAEQARKTKEQEEATSTKQPEKARGKGKRG